MENSKNPTLATVTSAENLTSGHILQFIEEARQNAVAHLNPQQVRAQQAIRVINARGTQKTFIKAANGTIKMASTETGTGQSRNLVEGELTIKITDEKKPALVVAGNFTAVIMPELDAAPRQ